MGRLGDEFDDLGDMMAPRGGVLAGLARCTIVALALAALVLLCGWHP